MISLDFKELISSGDVYEIKKYLIDNLMNDLTFNIFYEYLAYAEKNIEIIEEHDGKIFEEDKNKWNIRYLNFQKNKLLENFSRKRIEHVKNIIKEIYVSKGNSRIGRSRSKNEFNESLNTSSFSKNKYNKENEDRSQDRSEYGRVRRKKRRIIEDLNEENYDLSSNEITNKNEKEANLIGKATKDRSGYSENRRKNSQNKNTTKEEYLKKHELKNNDLPNNRRLNRRKRRENLNLYNKHTLSHMDINENLNKEKSVKNRSGYSENRRKKLKKIYMEDI